MPILIFVIFTLTAICAFIPKQAKNVFNLVLGMGIVSSAVAFYTMIPPLFSNQILELGGMLRIDKFSALIGVLITTLYFFAVLISHRYISEEYREGILNLFKVRLYYLLLPLFALAMLTVIMADNLGLLWLALETTTLVTTPLVAIYKKDGSLEAAWKYMILCSLGISLGLLGVLLLSYAGVQSGLSGLDSMSIKMLITNAPKMIPEVMKWAFIFCFIGLGTKVGFFPLHTWLPDAHGRTPAPISAMLSGILLNVALYALLRVKGITDIALGSDQWTNNLFLIFGVMSIVASAFFLFIQRNYKRMLAYSSMEHMGLIAVAIGLGPLGLVPATMHMVAHTLSKSLLFFGSGEILLHTKTAKIYKIKSLINQLPKTVILFTIGMISLLAFPPFATFSSEVMILSAAITKGQIIPFFLIIISLSIICISFFKHAFDMFSHSEDQTEDSAKIAQAKEKFNVTHLVMIIQIVLLIAGGIFMFTNTGFDFFSSIADSIYH
ncbi:MAG: proton-conducting transporter membrane subunit [Candidatus Gracilibacteria bacterium]|jgi:hydrogenase-4 component F